MSDSNQPPLDPIIAEWRYQDQPCQCGAPSAHSVYALRPPQAFSPGTFQLDGVQGGKWYRLCCACYAESGRPPIIRHVCIKRTPESAALGSKNSAR